MERPGQFHTSTPDWQLLGDGVTVSEDYPNVQIDFKIEEDIPAELEDFVLLWRFGKFTEALELFPQTLQHHLDLFPVVAEYADMLVYQENYSGLGEFLSSLSPNFKPPAEEREVLDLLRTIAELHTHDILLSGYSKASQWLRTTKMKVDCFEETDIQALELYLQIICFVYVNSNLLQRDESQPPWTQRGSEITPWAGFCDWCIVLAHGKHWWESQRIFQHLVQVLPNEQALSLLGQMQQVLESQGTESAALLATGSAANALIVHQRNQLREASSDLTITTKQILDWAVREANVVGERPQGRLQLEMLLHHCQVDYMSDPAKARFAWSVLRSNAKELGDRHIVSYVLSEMSLLMLVGRGEIQLTSEAIQACLLSLQDHFAKEPLDYLNALCNLTEAVVRHHWSMESSLPKNLDEVSAIFRKLWQALASVFLTRWPTTPRLSARWRQSCMLTQTRGIKSPESLRILDCHWSDIALLDVGNRFSARETKHPLGKDERVHISSLEREVGHFVAQLRDADENVRKAAIRHSLFFKKLDFRSQTAMVNPLRYLRSHADAICEIYDSFQPGSDKDQLEDLLWLLGITYNRSWSTVAENNSSPKEDQNFTSAVPAGPNSIAQGVGGSTKATEALGFSVFGRDHPGDSADFSDSSRLEHVSANDSNEQIEKFPTLEEPGNLQDHGQQHEHVKNRNNSRGGGNIDEYLKQGEADLATKLREMLLATDEQPPLQHDDPANKVLHRAQIGFIRSSRMGDSNDIETNKGRDAQLGSPLGIPPGIPPSILTSGVGLAAHFTRCVECFDYVQFGRNLWEAHQNYLVKIDVVRLRLSRWGVSVGLAPDLTEPRPYTVASRTAASDAELDLVTSTLHLIIRSFDIVEATSVMFKIEAEKAKSTELALYDPDNDPSSRSQLLHLKIRGMASRRYKRTSVLQKATWALYEKNKFDRLIEDITTFLDTLEKESRGSQEYRGLLCIQEVSEIENTEDLRLLGDIAGKDDPLLADTVTTELAHRGMKYQNFEIDADYVSHYDYFSRRLVANYVHPWRLEKEITKQLQEPREGGYDKPRTPVIFGFGGSGKSQLILNYIREHRKRYSAVFWIEAGQKESIERDYIQMYRLLFDSIAYGDANSVQLADVVLAVKNWVYRQDGRVLIVMDGADSIGNADDLSYIDLEYFLPDAPSVDKIITTRSPRARNFGTLDAIEVAEMESEEAAELFCKYAHLDNDVRDIFQEVLKIVKELNYVALTIALAGSYVATTPRLVSDLRQYLLESGKRRKQLLSLQLTKYVHQYGESLLSTLETSFVAMTRHSSMASRLLNLVAFLNFDDIFLDLFNAAFQADNAINTGQQWRSYMSSDTFDEYDVESAFTVLHTFSLVQWRHSQGVCTMHKLVHSWARDRLGTNQQSELSEAVLGLLTDIIPAGRSRVVYGARLVPHVMSNFDVVSTLYSSRECSDNVLSLIGVIGDFLRQLGRWSDLYQVHSFLFRKTCERAGAKHPRTLTSMNNLAKLLRDQGKYEEAVEMHREALAAREEVLGNDHPDTLTSMNDLAKVLSDQGKYEEAVEIYQEALVAREKVLGKEHPDTLTSVNNLALVLSDQGKYGQAEEMYRRTLELRETALGKEHPSTLTSMANLAATYLDQGRWTEAEKLNIEVMEISLRVLGEKHPSTLTSMNNLASIFLNQGRWTEAEKLDIQVTETRKRVLGEEHLDTLTSMANLAATYQNQGRLKEAENLQVQVMETRKRVLGEEHPSTLVSMNNLASTLLNQGQWTEAEKLDMQVTETRKRVLGEEHPSTLTSMKNLARTLKSKGRDNEALELMTTFVQLSRKKLGADHPNTKAGTATLIAWTPK